MSRDVGKSCENAHAQMFPATIDEVPQSSEGPSSLTKRDKRKQRKANTDELQRQRAEAAEAAIQDRISEAVAKVVMDFDQRLKRTEQESAAIWTLRIEKVHLVWDRSATLTDNIS